MSFVLSWTTEWRSFWQENPKLSISFVLLQISRTTTWELTSQISWTKMEKPKISVKRSQTVKASFVWCHLHWFRSVTPFDPGFFLQNAVCGDCGSAILSTGVFFAWSLILIFSSLKCSLLPTILKKKKNSSVHVPGMSPPNRTFRWNSHGQQGLLSWTTQEKKFKIKTHPGFVLSVFFRIRHFFRNFSSGSRSSLVKRWPQDSTSLPKLYTSAEMKLLEWMRWDEVSIWWEIPSDNTTLLPCASDILLHFTKDKLIHPRRPLHRKIMRDGHVERK